MIRLLLLCLFFLFGNNLIGMDDTDSSSSSNDSSNTRIVKSDIPEGKFDQLAALHGNSEASFIYRRLEMKFPQIMNNPHLNTFLRNTKGDGICSGDGFWASWQAKEIADLLVGHTGSLKTGTRENSWRVQNIKHAQAILLLSEIAKQGWRKALNQREPRPNDNSSPPKILHTSSLPAYIQPLQRD